MYRLQHAEIEHRRADASAGEGEADGVPVIVRVVTPPVAKGDVAAAGQVRLLRRDHVLFLESLDSRGRHHRPYGPEERRQFLPEAEHGNRQHQDGRRNGASTQQLGQVGEDHGNLGGGKR